ncbi:SDR family oxidoreductase [Cellulophaga baltica]|uniref:SDR family oxidoreductase n=1 Tax=Cellulophaga TaxID=104264 RepID=UPI001C07274C|nr:MULTISPECIES: SDR family oxidoreductase [Cellulophaga]MBU2996067.1 SDR family oxidoreductase [Cellulophaga baltica]MDO6767462.1 SDR family oxidoreductase [Cellulophaga sp. 1_MG-2023]
MNDKVVLITGGSSGIGKSIGVFLKTKGFKVYGTTRSTAKYPDFKEFNLLELDVKVEETISRAVAKLIELEGKIDILINNAGVGITGPIEETPNSEIEKAFDTNFYGPIRMAKAVLPQMRKQNSGLIINITSIAGYMGLPYRGIYSATKGALELVTEAMRMEVKDFGVQMTNLAPGDFATNIASGRYHTPVFENSAYEKPYGATLKAINDGVDSGGDPIQVAHEVFKIINTGKPKVHYKVGDFMQKFSLKLKNILPDKVYEKLLLNHYKL